MPLSPTPRYDYGRYDYTTYGGTAQKYLGYDAPWYIKTLGGGIRVDGLSDTEPPSPIIPGRTVTYECVFRPQPPRGASTDDHVARFEDARDLLVKAPDVATYDPPGPEAFYREQHGAADGAQLVRIGPLAPEAGGDNLDQTQPPSRSSVHQDRWAVVVGGEVRAPRPDVVGVVSLEATTIASTETFATREEVRDARENNGF